MAGQYTMTFDAYDNQAPGCGVWAMNGLTTFGYDPPCSGEPLGFYGGGAMPAGARIGMQTNAPPGVAIIAALVDPYEIENINDNQGWGGGSYYAGGGSGWGSGAAVESDSGFSSSYWGFQMICGWSSCSNFGSIYLNSIQLTAEEDQGPSLTAVGSDNLWYQAGHWVWNPPGDLWSTALSGTDPSGVCQMWATLNGVQINSPGQTPDTAVWQQCPDWTWSASVDTRNYVPASGSLALTLAGSNAAGVVSAPAEKLDVDNDPVQLSLSGPTTASTSSGTQYVTATASAGPSGVAIGCSLDGSPQRWQSGTVEQVPVGGAGDHVVSCEAHNGAVDPQGQYAYSAPQSWSLDIGEPTVSAIGFAKIADALKCGRARERVTIPAHWATVRRHHQLVHVHKRAHTKTVSVERCHPRIVWQRRTVWVAVRRHGKLVSVKRTKRVRVPLIPHTVMQAKKRVAYGRGTAVSGWLGTAERGRDRRCAGGGRDRAEQRGGAVHRCGRGHDGGGRGVERAAGSGSLAAGRGGVRRQRLVAAGDFDAGRGERARADHCVGEPACGAVGRDRDLARASRRRLRSAGRRGSAPADSLAGPRSAL